MKRIETASTVPRILCLALGVLFVLGLLQVGIRLKKVQIDDVADYNYASARQSVRRVQVSGSRGRILDRHGSVLADNRLALSIVCHPSAFQKRTWAGTVNAISQAVDRVAAKISKPSSLTSKAIRRHINQSLALSLTVWSDIGENELALFSENEADFPGFSVLETEERVYPQGSLAAHVLGYVGRERVSTEAGDERFNFVAREMRGRSGIELYYDSFLRGVPGEKRLLVDARGFAIREWTVTDSHVGPDLVLSLDSALQREVERQLTGVRGACAVLDPRTGEVLALASAPGFNPNDFVPSLSHDLYARLIEDKEHPLLNRAAGGAYTPGSIFKPITALAALSVGYPEKEPYVCTGVFSLGALKLHCSRRWGHGTIDMRHAIMKSCNPFFCNLAMECGTNALIRTAHEFGLGRKTGIDLGVDMAGAVPDAAWKQRMYGEKWYPGDVAQMAIGQGMLLVSPLQMARVAGAIGTGFLVTPHLKRDTPSERRALNIPAKQMAIIRDGMRLVVAGDGESRGTGWKGGEDVAVAVAGKTGTAEVGRGANRRKNTWFMAYAPADAPRVALALVVENGESGGMTAAPRAGAILRSIFND